MNKEPDDFCTNDKCPPYGLYGFIVCVVMSVGICALEYSLERMRPYTCNPPSYAYQDPCLNAERTDTNAIKNP